MTLPFVHVPGTKQIHTERVIQFDLLLCTFSLNWLVFLVLNIKVLNTALQLQAPGHLGPLIKPFVGCIHLKAITVWLPYLHLL